MAWPRPLLAPVGARPAFNSGCVQFAMAAKRPLRYSCAMKLSLLMCLALSWLTTAGAAETKPIKVNVGQEFKLTLQYNASTGYQWVLGKPADEKLVKLLGTEYKRLDSKLVGAGGDMVWTFQALAEGKAQIGLNYVRPWEKDAKPAQTTNFVVVIKAKKEKEKKPDANPGN